MSIAAAGASKRSRRPITRQRPGEEKLCRPLTAASTVGVCAPPSAHPTQFTTVRTLSRCTCGGSPANDAEDAKSAITSVIAGSAALACSVTLIPLRGQFRCRRL